MNGTHAERLANGVEPTVLVGQLVTDLVADGLDIEFKVTGGSMSPFIRSEDVITVCHIPPERLRCGQVVATPRPEGRIVVHRIIRRQGGSVLTRGDNSPHLDPWVDAEEVIGRIMTVTRGGRRVRFGLGAERSLIALLSRLDLLIPLLRPLRWLRRRLS